MTPKRKFTLRLPEELNDQLELIAYVQRTSKNAIIIEAVEKHLADQPKVSDPRNE